MGNDQDGMGSRGDDAGFEAFVVDASPALFRSAVVLTGDRGDAEDLLQTALLRTLRRWDAITGPPAAYAFTVLVNLSRDRHRNERRRPREAPEHERRDASAVDPIERAINRSAITGAARQLPSAQREILACRFLMDMTVAETAAALGLPEGTVKSYTSRALDRMRELLAGDAAANPDVSIGGSR